MKKVMKICAIVAAILLVLGIVLVLAGGLNGGLRAAILQARRGELNFGSNDLKILDIEEHLINWDENFGWDDDDKYTIGNQNMFDSGYEIVTNQESWEGSYAVSEFLDAEFQIGGCEVVWEESTDDQIHITAENVKKLQTYVANQTLYVRALSTTSVGKNVMRLVIAVPAEQSFRELDMELGAGDFTVNVPLTAQDMEISVGAGNFEAEKLTSGELSCEVGAGKAVISDAEVEGEAAFSVGAGEMNVSGTFMGDMSAEVALGNMEITVYGSGESDHNYRMECAAGNLTVGSISISALAGEKNISNGAATTYELECAMGNLNVMFR